MGWPLRGEAADFGAVTNGDWGTATTWTDGTNPGVPGAGDRAFVGGGFVAGQAASAAVSVTTNAAVTEVFMAFQAPGTASIDILPGGALIAAGRLHVGMHPGGTGTLTQAGGVLAGGGDMVIGDGGPGAVAISAGLATRAGIYVALGASGALTMTGGTVTNNGSLVIGHGGGNACTARVTVAGACMANAGQTEIGTGAPGDAQFSNAVFLTSGLFVANGQQGSLVLVDAVVTNLGTFMVGHGGGAAVTGRVSMIGGRLDSSIGQFGVGNDATGLMTVSNAWMRTGQFFMGQHVDGAFAMSDSVLINASGGFRGGLNRSASFVQVGGTNLVDGGEFWMGEAEGTTNTYTLSGADALLRATNGRQLIGVYGGSNTFNQLDGHVEMNDLQVPFTGSDAPIGVYNLLGGSLNTVRLSKNGNPKSSFAFAGGTLSADTVTFNLVNRGGTLSPGRTNSLGRTQIEGSYTVESPAGGLAIQVGETNAGLTNDVLQCSGAVTLDGAMRVNLVGDYVPETSNAFVIVTGSLVSGTFANAPVSGQRYNFGDTSFVVTYSGTSVALSDYRDAQPPSALLIQVR
jgi:hypothetical protein